MNLPNALAALLASLPEGMEIDLAASLIGDAAEGDTDDLDYPVIALLRNLFDAMPESDNLDITAIVEHITPLHPDLAEAICSKYELCPTCFSDLDICDC